MSVTVWIGGGTGAGKSTLARALAARHGLRRFAVDSRWYAYEARAGGSPRRSPDEQWLDTPPHIQALEFEEVSVRNHRFVLEELAESSIPTVVEGPQIQPDLVPPGDSAVFLDPTPAFQRSVLRNRSMPSSDPERALANRLVKDRLYADRISARAREAGLPVLVVDGTRPLVDEAEAVLAIPDAAVDLAAVRRWENERAAANIRAWFASPEAPAVHPTFAFVCECGRRGCDAQVQLTLAEFEAAGRVLAEHAVRSPI